MAFPTSPANNLIALVNGIEYVWNASKGAWYRYGDTTANVITANTFQALSGITIAGGLGATGPTASIYATQSQLSQDTINTNLHLYTLGMFSGNTDQSIQIGAQNFANTQNSSTDFAIYNNLGTDSNNYIDMGITSTGYNVALNNFTASQPGDGYLYANGSNLIIGTYTPGTNMKIFVGGYQSNNVVATFSANGISSNVVSTNISNNSIGYLGTPQNQQSGNYTLTLSDAGKQIFLNLSSNTSTLTVPPNSSVPFPVGTTITVVTANNSYSANIANSGSSSLYLIPSTTPRTNVRISGYSAASLSKIQNDIWWVTGVGVV